MENLLAEDLQALRLLMTEDLYKMHGEEQPQPRAEIPAKKQPEIQPSVEAPVFSYLGDNNKYFLILVDDKKHQHLNSTDKESLLKILQAKGMELRDVAILNINSHPNVDFNSIKQFFVPSRIVFFGLSVQHFNIPSISSNSPEKYQDVKLLSTYSFEEMQNDINKKKTFWNVMKSF